MNKEKLLYALKHEAGKVYYEYIHEFKSHERARKRGKYDAIDSLIYRIERGDFDNK